MLSDMYQELAVIERRQPAGAQKPSAGEKVVERRMEGGVRKKLTLESCAEATSAGTVGGSSARKWVNKWITITMDGSC